MSKPDRCQLTTRDHSILESMLERNVGHEKAFLQLLRRKLAAAWIVFDDAIGPQVATINSRVDFTVDGGVVDNRILISSKDNTLPGLTLPITTLRGLALLGMAAGEMITIERADGRPEELCLEWVSHQPEASRKKALYPPLHRDTATALQQVPVKSDVYKSEERTRPQESARSGNGATVVLLSAHRKSAAMDSASPPLTHGDDDPGPSAA
jgi:regulator of nucleoside diphosphate kinase